MNLSVTCRECEDSTPVKPSARDRLALSRKLGSEFHHRCERCGASETYHVDDVTASSGRAKLWGLIAALGAAALFTAVLWDLGWISTLTLIIFGGIYFAVQQSADAKAEAFNGYTLR